jgi:hypothetical protein
MDWIENLLDNDNEIEEESSEKLNVDDPRAGDVCYQDGDRLVWDGEAWIPYRTNRHHKPVKYEWVSTGSHYGTGAGTSDYWSDSTGYTWTNDTINSTATSSYTTITITNANPSVTWTNSSTDWSDIKYNRLGKADSWSKLHKKAAKELSEKVQRDIDQQIAWTFGDDNGIKNEIMRHASDEVKQASKEWYKVKSGKWYHVCYDRSTNTLFIDGQKVNDRRKSLNTLKEHDLISKSTYDEMMAELNEVSIHNGGGFYSPIHVSKSWQIPKERKIWQESEKEEPDLLGNKFSASFKNMLNCPKT